MNELVHTPEWPFTFHYAVLPTQYDVCFDRLKAELKKIESTGVKIEGVLSIGEGAEEFKIETQANNLDDVPNFPDNAGVTRVLKRIFEDLPKTATLPLRFPFAAFGRIRSSINPGFYICNHLCAKMSREWSADESAPHAGFIHVPRAGEGGVFTADVCAAMIVNGFKKLG